MYTRFISIILIWLCFHPVFSQKKFVIKDSISCVKFNGEYFNNSNTCLLDSSFIINSVDTLELNLNTVMRMKSPINIYGYLINNSALLQFTGGINVNRAGNKTGVLINNGYLSNPGEGKPVTITNYGKIINHNRILAMDSLKNFGTIICDRYSLLEINGYVQNKASMQFSDSCELSISSVFDNYGTAIFNANRFAALSITIHNGGIYNNYNFTNLWSRLATGIGFVSAEIYGTFNNSGTLQLMRAYFTIARFQESMGRFNNTGYLLSLHGNIGIGGYFNNSATIDNYGSIDNGGSQCQFQNDSSGVIKSISEYSSEIRILGFPLINNGTIKACKENFIVNKLEGNPIIDICTSSNIKNMEDRISKNHKYEYK